MSQPAPESGPFDHELFLSGMFEAPVGLAVADPDGRVRFASRELRTLLGIDPAARLDRSIAELTHPDDRRISIEALRRMRVGELDAWRTEKRYVRPDGRAVWAHLELRPVRDAGGTLRAYVAAIRDGAGRMPADERTEELKSHLGRVIGSLPMVLYEVRIHGQEVVPQWSSPSIERVLGWTPQDSLDPEWWSRNLHPDDAGRANDATRMVLTNGSVHRTYRFRNAKGEYRWIRDELCLQGRVDEEQIVLGMLLDVTEEIRAQEERWAQEERYHRLMERRSEILVVVSPDFVILFDMPSRTPTLGYGPEQSVGLDLRTLLHPEDVPRFEEAAAEALERSGATVSTELRARHRDGGWRTLEGTITNLLDDPAIGGLLINAHDVTDQRTAEQHLRQAQKLELFGDLTAGIVHDLNNVLSVVIAAADLMAEEMDRAGAPDPQNLVDLRAAARGGSDLVRKLLAFGHAGPLEVVPLEVERALDEIGAMLRRLIPSSVTISIRAEPSLPRILADPGALSQILVNLATNARDAMPKGGLVEIGARRIASPQGAYVRITVRDTGAGMDAATLERMFAPFFSTKPTGRGTGLGMSIVSALVQRQSGRIEVESALGEGTTVHIELPATDAPAAVPTPEGPREHVRGHETILFVDDVPELRRTATRIFRRLGYTVHTAEDGVAALELLELHPEVDLVISDGDMPRMHGLELHDELRRRLPDVRFVLSSGFRPEDLGERGLAATHNFLQKPWTLEDLERAVRRALDG